MLHWGVQCDNRKKNTSAQKHIYHKHMTCNRGNISSSGKQPSGPVPFITAPVADLLALVVVQSGTEAVERGRAVMSVMGEGSKRVYSASLSQGSLSSMTLATASRYGGARKDKIELLCLLGRTAAYLHSSFSLSILVSEIINFHLQSREFQHDGIHIPVYSLSLIADRSSRSFNQNGQPCETLDSCSRLPNFSITQGKA